MTAEQSVGRRLPSDESSQSLARALTVLRTLDDASMPLAPLEVAAATGLHRATARRLLLALVDLGYVAAVDDRFALRAEAVDLGVAYLSSLGLPSSADRILGELAARTKETAALSVLDGGDVVCVAAAAPDRLVAARLGVGARRPVKECASGRVLRDGELAATVEPADHRSAWSIAVAVDRPNRRFALELVGAASRGPSARRHGPILCEVASRLSADGVA